MSLNSADVTAEYRDRIRRYIERIVHDPDEAEDLTQETFLRVHRRLDSLRDSATLSTWLYRIATNVCHDRFRKSSHRNPAESLEAMGPEIEIEDRDDPRMDEVIDRTEMSACVRHYIESLSDNYRTVILLHDLEGMTNPEIAQVLGCSLATVKIRLHRARTRLRETLKAVCEFTRDERGVLVCERKPRCS